MLIHLYEHNGHSYMYIIRHCTWKHVKMPHVHRTGQMNNNNNDNDNDNNTNLVWVKELGFLG